MDSYHHSYITFLEASHKVNVGPEYDTVMEDTVINFLRENEELLKPLVSVGNTAGSGGVDRGSVTVTGRNCLSLSKSEIDAKDISYPHSRSLRSGSALALVPVAREDGGGGRGTVEVSSAKDIADQAVPGIALNIDGGTSDMLRVSHQPISVGEVFVTIRKAKNRKAPGKDGVFNVMLKQLPPAGFEILTVLLESCLMMGYFPVAWKQAIGIMLPKPGKDHSSAGGYRPISLLSAVGKVFEKIIAARMTVLLEEANFF